MLESIAENIGVSEDAVKLKAHKIGFIDILNASSGFLSIPFIANILGRNPKTIYNWVDKGIIKTRRFKIGESYRKRVRYTAFITFLKLFPKKYDTRFCNLDYIKSLMIVNGVYSEPEWLESKIKEDYLKDMPYIRKNWTTKEEELLLSLIEEGNTIKEITIILKRSYYSVAGKARNLKRVNK